MSASGIVVEKMEIMRLEPNIKGSPLEKEIKARLPKHGQYSQSASIIVHGANNAIINGLRRILLNEMNNYVLRIDPDSFECDDAFIFIDMLTQRVALIPFDQDVATSISSNANIKFTLSVINKSEEPLNVYSASLVPSVAALQKELPYCETIPVVTLQPHRHISFTATLHSGYGYADAIYATASSAIAIPLDQRPIDVYDPKAREPRMPYNDKATYLETCSISNPRVYMLTFETTSKGDPRNVLKRACAALIERANALKLASVLRPTGQQAGSSAAATAGNEHIGRGDLYLIKMTNETATIGNLFMRCCLDVYPDIDAVSFTVDDRNNELVIKIRTTIPIDKVIGSVIAYAVDKIDAISRAIH